MTQDQLENIANRAPAELGTIIAELGPHILTASAQALTKTQDEEGGGKPKVRIGLSIVVDLAKSPPAWHCEGAVSVKHLIKGENHDEDATPTLPGID